MKKVVRLTENDLNRIIRKVLSEQMPQQNPVATIEECLIKGGLKLSDIQSCKSLQTAFVSGNQAEVNKLFPVCTGAIGLKFLQLRDVQKGLEIVSCISDKISPVMS